MRSGLRHLIGAAILIVAVGLPSCIAFKEAVASAPAPALGTAD